MRKSIGSPLTLGLLVACSSAGPKAEAPTKEDRTASIELAVDALDPNASAPKLRALLYRLGDACPDSSVGLEPEAFGGVVWVRPGTPRTLRVRSSQNLWIESEQSAGSTRCKLSFGFVPNPGGEYHLQFRLEERRCAVEVLDELGRTVPTFDESSCQPGGA